MKLWGDVGVIFSAAFLAALAPALAQPAKTRVEAEPITYPVPSYPNFAAWWGIIGYCEVVFSVDARGLPFSLQTSCTRPVFCYQSKKAVNEATFRPAYVNGITQPRYNVVYPLEYIFDDTDPEKLDRTQLKPCKPISVS